MTPTYDPESTVARPLLALANGAPSSSAASAYSRRRRRQKAAFACGGVSLVLLLSYGYLGPAAGLPVPEHIAPYSYPSEAARTDVPPPPDHRPPLDDPQASSHPARPSPAAVAPTDRSSPLVNSVGTISQTLTIPPDNGNIYSRNQPLVASSEQTRRVRVERSAAPVHKLRCRAPPPSRLHPRHPISTQRRGPITTQQSCQPSLNRSTSSVSRSVTNPAVGTNHVAAPRHFRPKAHINPTRSSYEFYPHAAPSPPLRPPPPLPAPSIATYKLAMLTGAGTRNLPPEAANVTTLRRVKQIPGVTPAALQPVPPPHPMHFDVNAFKMRPAGLELGWEREDRTGWYAQRVERHRVDASSSSDAISFSAAFVWCGFQTGNFAQLALAVARILGTTNPADRVLLPADILALTSLLAFNPGAFTGGRTGDRIGAQSARGLSAAPSSKRRSHSARGFALLSSVAMGLMAASLGVQGVIGKRLGTNLSTTVVPYRPMDRAVVADPHLFKSPTRRIASRDHRALALFVLFGGAIIARLMLGQVGAAATLGFATGLRMLIAASWLFVKGKGEGYVRLWDEQEADADALAEQTANYGTVVP
ncbi:hypothetical protein MKEN_00587100 [Mycena kentingensis (nom. inval.)]|nr:hypothetical protein MKEN_00587100 [Mycena kentingensis (nom. inval.)]